MQVSCLQREPRVRGYVSEVLQDYCLVSTGVKPSKEFEIVIIHLAEVAVFAP